jgi:hypothetical protein
MSGYQNDTNQDETFNTTAGQVYPFISNVGDGTSDSQHDSDETYGAITAKNFDADVSIVAYSGRGEAAQASTQSRSHFARLGLSVVGLGFSLGPSMNPFASEPFSGISRVRGQV